MKKFLQKKPVMISFVVAAVLFLAVYIGMLVRPISYGYNYTHKETEGEVTSIGKINVKSNKVLRNTLITKEKGKDDEKQVVDCWVYVDGSRVMFVGYKEVIEAKETMKEYINANLMTKEDYKKKAEELSKLSDEEFNAAFKAAEAVGMGYDFGIYKLEVGDGENAEIYKNNQAIAFTVVHGIVTLALVAFAGLSVFCVIKKK